MLTVTVWMVTSFRSQTGGHGLLVALVAQLADDGHGGLGLGPAGGVGAWQPGQLQRALQVAHLAAARLGRVRRVGPPPAAAHQRQAAQRARPALPQAVSQLAEVQRVLAVAAAAAVLAVVADRAAEDAHLLQRGGVRTQQREREGFVAARQPQLRQPAVARRHRGQHAGGRVVGRAVHEQPARTNKESECIFPQTEVRFTEIEQFDPPTVCNRYGTAHLAAFVPRESTLLSENFRLKYPEPRNLCYRIIVLMRE